ncbi:tyrosine-protein phosphatase [Kineococcus gynurae]|uniref:Tyrosine-protein phosphatase n=1 Tax=Kineococcus gynurae TaxID=452979 RepID=A0ABV5LT69_9ACTN
MSVPDEPLDRLANLRDVSDAAPQVVPGVLWRSSQPLAGDGPPENFPAWPPRTVVDLRSAAEVGDTPHPLLGEGTTVQQVHLLDAAGDPEALADRRRSLAEVYLSMLEPGTGLVRAVELVADAPGPVLVHCAAGKDRTGIVVALALRLAGVAPASVLADFALTTQAMPAVMRRLLASMPGLADVDVSTVPAEFFTAPAEALQAVLDVWDAAPGGVEGWARAHGGSPDLAGRLTRRLAPEGAA